MKQRERKEGKEGRVEWDLMFQEKFFQFRNLGQTKYNLTERTTTTK